MLFWLQAGTEQEAVSLHEKKKKILLQQPQGHLQTQGLRPAQRLLQSPSPSSRGSPSYSMGGLMARSLGRWQLWGGVGICCTTREAPAPHCTDRSASSLQTPAAQLAREFQIETNLGPWGKRDGTDQ